MSRRLPFLPSGDGGAPTKETPTSAEETAALKMVRVQRMIAEAWEEFQPARSGQISVVIRDHLPSHVVVTTRDDLIPVQVQNSSPGPRFPGASRVLVEAVVGQEQWPRFGTVTIEFKHGVPVAVERSRSMRL